MDSPLSRSPGSRVLIGVGLPITRASSPLGGPHRLEYWGTPPQRRSPPLVLPPPPPLHWPMEWDCAAPIRFWLDPWLACQLVVFAPSDWPCAKKRFTSSSPANSARMVVFPSTHLKNMNGISQVGILGGSVHVCACVSVVTTPLLKLLIKMTLVVRSYE